MDAVYDAGVRSGRSRNLDIRRDLSGQYLGSRDASKEAEAEMSVETRRSAEQGAAWNARQLEGEGRSARRRSLVTSIAEVRGPAAIMRRDALFRRALLA